MGNKRKRSDDQQHNKDLASSSTTPFDRMPCFSGMELLSNEALPVDSRELNSLSSVRDFMDSPEKLLNAPCSIAHHHQSLGRALFLKRSRRRYSHQYSRRISTSHPPASTSQGNVTPLDDEKLPFKLASQFYTDSIGHADPGNQEKTYFRPEIIKSSSLAMDAESPDMMRVTCGTCQMPLRRKPCMLGNTVSSSEPSVVAVLVCGHFYHADCLEQKTCSEDKRDPPCPLCLDLLSKADDTGGHN